MGGNLTDLNQLIIWFTESPYILYLIIFLPVIIALLYFSIKSWKYKGRIQVRIKTSLGEKVKILRPEADGKSVILEGGGRRSKNPLWKVNFSRDSIYNAKASFGNLKTIDVYQDAPEAISWDFDKKTVDMPRWDRQTAKKFIDAEALKVRFFKMPKIALPGLFWGVLFIAVANLILVLYFMYKMGIFK